MSIDKIAEQYDAFLKQLFTEYDYDEVITSLITFSGQKIADRADTSEEAMELGRLFSHALMGAVEVAAGEKSERRADLTY